MNLANEFLMEYQDSAAFMAAYIMTSSASVGSDGSSKELREKAQAFMNIYSDDMHGWYDYNSAVTASGGESILVGLEKVPHTCRCLPRHNKNCPKT